MAVEMQDTQKSTNKVVLSRISEKDYNALKDLTETMDHEFYARSISSCLKAIIGRYVQAEENKKL
tara:strand:+ start:194 stop:388 length:195 start_codon:yes stop_codon:yes gene_type:complete